MTLFLNGEALSTRSDLGKTFGGRNESSSFDLNNLYNDTIFCNNQIPVNAPSDISKWVFYLCVGNRDTPSVQFAIEAGWKGRIFTRNYSGNPAAWSKWTLIHNNQRDINNLDQRITNLENKLGGVNSPLYFTYLQELEVA